MRSSLQRTGNGWRGDAEKPFKGSIYCVGAIVKTNFSLVRFGIEVTVPKATNWDSSGIYSSDSMGVNWEGLMGVDQLGVHLEEVEFGLPKLRCRYSHTMRCFRLE